MSNRAKRLLADIQDLAPEIIARAAEIEAGHRVPLDLVETLKSLGVFRMFAPHSHGGLELDLPEGLEIIRALGRIDGSVGWTAMIGSGSGIFAPLLPRETYEHVYRNGADLIFAGSTAPVGTAETAPGGWRVNGRWPFASGCLHADWMIGLCVMSEAGKPTPGEGGRSQIRGVFLPPHDWQIEDTWYAAGLKGTGSHHISLKDVIVPAENFFDFENGAPCVPGPLYQTVPHLLPLFHSAISVGMAEGAVDDLLTLVETGRQQLRAAAPMRESEIFQFEFGRVEADLRAARASLAVQAASHWRHALAGTLKSEALRTQGTQTGIWISTTCVRVADACFALAGGSAVYESSPLQRRLRDLHTAAQHASVHQRHYVAAGIAALDLFRSQPAKPRQLAAAEQGVVPLAGPTKRGWSVANTSIETSTRISHGQARTY